MEPLNDPPDRLTYVNYLHAQTDRPAFILYVCRCGWTLTTRPGDVLPCCARRAGTWPAWLQPTDGGWTIVDRD